MKFLKENSYDVVRLYINQIGITIFSLIMYTAGGMISTDDTGITLGIRIAISVFATLFYFMLIYTAVWENGAKDKIRIDGGRAEKDSLKGLKLALCANIPNILLGGLGLIFGLLYALTDIGGFYSTFSVLVTIFRFTASMYIGIIQGIFSALEGTVFFVHMIQTLGFLVLAIGSALVVHLGYSFGLREKKIFGFLKKK